MPNQDLAPYWQNYIDGRFCDGGAGRIDVNDPATGEKLAQHALADAADIDQAICSAQRVHQSGELSDLNPRERGRMVIEMGRYLADNANEIKRIITLEQGKPLFEAEVEVAKAAGLFEYFGSQIESLEGRSVPFDNTHLDFTVYRPFGVSAQFIPGHYPVYIPSRSLAAALVTGNACVLKTSELAPISGVWFARAAEKAGLPAGALNILCGRGSEAGAALAGHPGIDHLTFSGHVETACNVVAAGARNLVPSIVEAGGTSPTIVFEDADLDLFDKEARTGTYWNAGQICVAMYRVIVHESRYAELLDRAVALAQSLQLGPGIESGDFKPYMGPVGSGTQLDRVEAMVREAEQNGAKCLTGGSRMKRSGTFMQPTVLRDVRPDMRVANEEVFGPVMAVMTFRDEQEAYDLANATPYSGLMCGIFTQDLGRMTRAAHAVRAGHISINASFLGGPEIPFGGGFGRSGYGRVKGREALLGYVQTKNILLPAG